MTMNELARFAAGERMIPKAPVQATRSVQITAPLDKVWSILTGVSDWERWHPYLKDARLEGPFSADTQLTYGGFIKHKLPHRESGSRSAGHALRHNGGLQRDNPMGRKASQRNPDRSLLYGVFCRFHDWHAVQQSEVR